MPRVKGKAFYIFRGLNYQNDQAQDMVWNLMNHDNVIRSLIDKFNTIWNPYDFIYCFFLFTGHKSQI